MFNTLLTANNISYNLDSKTLFEDVNISIEKKDKIALIAPNGSGKTTLLKILTGEILANKKIETLGLISYFKQSYPEIKSSKLNIAEYLIKQKMQFDQVYTSHMRIWLEKLDFEKRLNHLSGGELTKLMIAIEASQTPDIFILDEPTNNLDNYSIERLIEYIKYFQGGLVFVSHNLNFLNNVPNKLWILEDKKLEIYNLNYTEYLEYKKILRNAREDQLRSLNKNIKKAKKALIFEKDRHQKEQSNQLKLKKKGNLSIPKMAAGFKKNESERSSGKKKNSLEKHLLELKQQKIELAEITSKKAYLQLATKKNNFNLITNIQTEILGKKILFSIYYGDRIAISGRNGSGKTTLCKYVFEKTADKFKVAYLDQKYKVVDSEKTVWENILDFNKNFGEQDLRRILGNFLFTSKEQINQKASTLSGGELVRLAFAMITAKELDLLILDEPLNNIDIQTQEVIIQGLNHYQGALIVVSHDKKFIDEINIKSRLNVE